MSFTKARGLRLAPARAEEMISLGDIDANPLLIPSLPFDQSHRLFRRMQFLQWEILEKHRPLGVVPAEIDPLTDSISAKDAAQLLGMSERVLRRRHHEPELAALRIDNGTRKRIYSRQRVLEHRARL
jgi:hypothetical protein